MAAPEKVKAFLTEPRNIVIAGLRRNGEPRLSPNWFCWDGEKFYVSTTRSRAKYRVFTRNPRGVVLVDGSTGARYVRVPVTIEIREDLSAELPRFRAIREKMGVAVAAGYQPAAEAIAAAGGASPGA
ncbi:MAG: pyridoxamine 5'-phosphate oxidase family protein [Streptosporangiaceae bacterium]